MQRKNRVDDPSKAVWIGNIPPGTTQEDLLELAKTFGDAEWAEVFRGSGSVGFGTAEEAQYAITVMNGAILGDAVIIADAWAKTGRPPSNGGKGKGDAGKGDAASPALFPPRQKGPPTVVMAPGKTAGFTPLWSAAFQKFGADAKGGSPDAKGGSPKGESGKGRRTRVPEPAKAVWIGNLTEGTTKEELLDMAMQVTDAKWAEVFRGTGAIGYASPEEAEAAIAALDGMELRGSAIQADTWTKK